ncbi:MAG TPA: RNA-binding domain-containing protein [Nitrososphaerales archaeon]|nr:RNA-binding domain-containing protein [Nitrososphaerales archaeon]
MESSIRVQASLRATVAPSEDPEKVRKAIENIVGPSSSSFEVDESRVRAWSKDRESLRVLRDQLRDRHVRAAARRLLIANRNRDSTQVMLNRQAAFHGVVALCGSEAESSLGPIYLEINSRELDAMIDWLTAYQDG